MSKLPAKSREIKAQRSPKRPVARDPHEARFTALLRRKCMRAATIGACTAAAESLPGFGKALGLVFGELLDVEMLAGVQRELIEETFELYELNLPVTVHNALLRKVQLAGSAASVAGDALARSLLHRVLRRVGSLVAVKGLDERVAVHLGCQIEQRVVGPAEHWLFARREIVERSIDRSLCFGLYHEAEQVGFARVVTDTVTTVSNLEVYLCGNGRMIRDVRTIVREKGLCPIYTEQYFS